MSRGRKQTRRLPQQEGRFFLTGSDLDVAMQGHPAALSRRPAVFGLLNDPRGEEALIQFYGAHLSIARAMGAGFILDTPTWQASHDWVRRRGRDLEEIDRINRQAVFFAASIRSFFKTATTRILLNGVVAPRGQRDASLAPATADEALAYHYRQVASLASAGVDMITALRMTSSEEAIGIALAAQEAGVPVVVSFSLAKRDRLASGEALGETVVAVDDACRGAPAYYQIEGADPERLERLFHGAGDWLGRVRGLRAENATLGRLRPVIPHPSIGTAMVDLMWHYRPLRANYPQLCVFGGAWLSSLRQITRTSLAKIAALAA